MHEMFVTQSHVYAETMSVLEPWYNLKVAVMSMVQVLLYSFVTAVAVAPLAGKLRLTNLRVNKCLKDWSDWSVCQ